MGLTENYVLRVVDTTIANHTDAGSIGVVKYAGTVLDQYKQGEPTYAAFAVPTTGRGIRQPNMDQLSMIGDGESVEIAFVWSRLELARRFPSAADPMKSIDTRDRLEFEGKTYRILSTHPTGKSHSVYTMLVVKAASLPGAVNDPIP